MATPDRQPKLELVSAEVGSSALFFQHALARKKSFPLEAAQVRNGLLGEWWIEAARPWSRGERVLDVGCGYATLPIHLARQYGCEVWGADDFGRDSDPFWLRGQDPEAFAAEHPEVKYVFARLGGPADQDIPDRFFDAVISNQALHVAPPPHGAIWRSMAAKLKPEPGSEIIVSMICNFATDGDPGTALSRLEDIRGLQADLLGRLVRDGAIPPGEWDAVQAGLGQSLHRFSPALYLTYLASVLGVAPFEIPGEFLAENFCTSVDALVNPVSEGFSIASFSGDPEEARRYRYGRYAPILLRFRIPDPTNSVAPRAGFDEWSEHGAVLSQAPRPSCFALNPVGTGGRALLAESPDEGTHGISREVPVDPIAPYRMTVLVRPRGCDYLGLWVRRPGTGDDTAEAFFDLSKARVSATNTYGTASVIGAGIEPAGDGWLRCRLDVDTIGTAQARLVVLLRDSPAGSSRYAGDPVRGVEIAPPRFERISGLA